MTVQVVLTVGEILLLVLVLAYFLRMLTKLLTHVGDTLQNVADGVRAIEGHCQIIGPGTDGINRVLGEAAANLERAAAATEALAP